MFHFLLRLARNARPNFFFRTRRLTVWSVQPLAISAWWVLPFLFCHTSVSRLRFRLRDRSDPAEAAFLGPPGASLQPSFTSASLGVFSIPPTRSPITTARGVFQSGLSLNPPSFGSSACRLAFCPFYLPAPAAAGLFVPVFQRHGFFHRGFACGLRRSSTSAPPLCSHDR